MATPAPEARVDRCNRSDPAPPFGRCRSMQSAENDMETKTPAVAKTRRWRALARMERWLEPAMVLLGVLWLAIVIIELAWGLASWLETLSAVIWVVFAVEFSVRLIIAPEKLAYLRRNWITAIALALPAFRILRFARALRLFRATRGLRLVRLLTSTNRGVRSLGRAMNRRGVGYVAVLTIAVTFAGAAGILVFEGSRPNGAFGGFGEALWWTAMVVTTLGSDYWPQTMEGRVLTLLLSIYAVGVFGYLAATLASYFVQQDTGQSREQKREAALASLHDDIRYLRTEIRALRHRRDANEE